MLIVCPNCAASYDVAAAKLAPTGRSVRCHRCRTTWLAHPGAALPALTAAMAGGHGGGRAAVPAIIPALETIEGTIEPARGQEIGSAIEPASELTIIDSPPLFHDAVAEGGGHENAASHDIETLATRRRSKVAARKKAPRLRPRLALAILGLAAVLACLVVWRATVVRYAPQTASLFKSIGLAVNVRGLAIENVKTLREIQDGVMVLIVEGTIANVVNRTVEVPRLRFALRNPAGLEIYAWTTVTGRTVLGTGETTPFRSRLASPPADGREVVVRFFNRRDIVAGAR